MNYKNSDQVAWVVGMEWRLSRLLDGYLVRANEIYQSKLLEQDI